MANPFDAPPKLILIAGAALLYAGGRAAARAISRNRPAPGRRAIGHWLPIVAVTFTAILFGQPDMAMSFIFATSIASLALVGGCIAVMGAAPEEPAVWPAPIRSVCALLLPAAALVFLAGFSGHMGRFNCAVLGAEGILLCFVWRGAARETDPAPPPIHKTSVIVAVILCAAGGWAAVHGAIGMTRDMDFPPSLVPAAIVLSPLLAAPMLLGGSELAQRGQAWAAHATHVGVAQLNLCALLPLAAVLWHIRWHATLVFPMANWRIDCVVLILLAAALLPAAAGRWRPRRLEGLFHIILYVVYVLAVITAAAE
jgi:hypothetical protein